MHQMDVSYQDTFSCAKLVLIHAYREDYTAAVDAKAWDNDPSSKWMTSNHTLQRSTGQVVSGGDASWSAIGKDIYAPFPSHLHYPEFAVVWEVDGGWEMLGVAILYYNLAAPGDGAKIKGKDGKQWDGEGPGAFQFRLAKQDDGTLKVASTAIFADPTGPMVQMLKRGMMKPEDLMK